MPNGTPDVGGGVGGSLELKIPGVPAEATSFGSLAETVFDFFGSLFGGGRAPPTPEEIATGRGAVFAPFETLSPQQRTIAGAVLGEDINRFRAPIPTPEQGGPPLVTERFADLPGPFVDPGLGILPFELRDIPEEEPAPFLSFQPRPIPEPDVLEETMAVDAPLIAQAGVGGLPALLQRTSPIVGGVLGGLAQDLVSGFLRAPQETGLGQLPAIPSRVACPPAAEKPSTRILRFIKANTGVSVKLTRAKSLIRELGLQNAARCLGISMNEACALIIAASPRRRRGISASDIRIVKRTARRFDTLKHDLSSIGTRSTAHVHRRRRHHHAHSHK